VPGVGHGDGVVGGVVDDVHLMVVPVVVGGGTSGWPRGARLDLDLVSQDCFADGTVHLHCRSPSA